MIEPAKNFSRLTAMEDYEVIYLININRLYEIVCTVQALALAFWPLLPVEEERKLQSGKGPLWS